MIPLHAERTRPQLAHEVHLGVRVEDGSAAVAVTADGVVRQWRGCLVPSFHGRVQASHGHHDPRRLEPRARPDIPRKPNRVPFFRAAHIPVLHPSPCFFWAGNITPIALPELLLSDCALLRG